MDTIIYDKEFIEWIIDNHEEVKELFTVCTEKASTANNGMDTFNVTRTPYLNFYVIKDDVKYELNWTEQDINEYIIINIIYRYSNLQNGIPSQSDSKTYNKSEISKNIIKKLKTIKAISEL